MIWFISDTHFGHTNIMKYEKRPFDSVEEMNSTMIKNWNSLVDPDDIVYHLGDFCFLGKYSEIIFQLRGKKILIVGNHDASPRKMEKLGFVASLESATVKIEHHTFFLSHRPCYDLPDGVWNLHGHVHSKWKTIHEKRIICLSVENWNYCPVSYKEIVREIKQLKRGRMTQAPNFTENPEPTVA